MHTEKLFKQINRNTRLIVWTCSKFQHLFVRSQLWKHQKNVWSLFKVNNKHSRKTLLTLFWFPYCRIWKDLTHCSSFSIVDFKRVNLGLVMPGFICLKSKMETIVKCLQRKVNNSAECCQWLWFCFFIIQRNISFWYIQLNFLESNFLSDGILGYKIWLFTFSLLLLRELWFLMKTEAVVCRCFFKRDSEINVFLWNLKDFLKNTFF